ncbi:MAG: hypothetical protein ACYTHM_08655, partial [Planctomycetota bacterium]
NLGKTAPAEGPQSGFIPKEESREAESRDARKAGLRDAMPAARKKAERQAPEPSEAEGEDAGASGTLKETKKKIKQEKAPSRGGREADDDEWGEEADAPRDGHGAGQKEGAGGLDDKKKDLARGRQVPHADRKVKEEKKAREDGWKAPPGARSKGGEAREVLATLIIKSENVGKDRAKVLAVIDEIRKAPAAGTRRGQARSGEPAEKLKYPKPDPKKPAGGPEGRPGTGGGGTPPAPGAPAAPEAEKEGLGDAKKEEEEGATEDQVEADKAAKEIDEKLRRYSAKADKKKKIVFLLTPAQYKAFKWKLGSGGTVRFYEQPSNALLSLRDLAKRLEKGRAKVTPPATEGAGKSGGERAEDAEKKADEPAPQKTSPLLIKVTIRFENMPLPSPTPAPAPSKQEKADAGEAPSKKEKK